VLHILLIILHYKSGQYESCIGNEKELDGTEADVSVPVVLVIALIIDILG